MQADGEIYTDNFCWWCGFSTRDKKGLCLVCYPPGHPLYSRDMFYSHVLFVRNKTIAKDLNPIPERIQPIDYMDIRNNSIDSGIFIFHDKSPEVNCEAERQKPKVSKQERFSKLSKRIKEIAKTSNFIVRGSRDEKDTVSLGT